MNLEKINRLLILVIVISFIIFFTLLNFRFAQEYPQVFSPTEEIENYVTSEIPQPLFQEIMPTSSY
ncbi:hypothetical protein HRbin35_00588 [bacterium HR35]|nr:hypothetical protein HRbin35_00588 [bacterium HR35]